jgi:hypothetical protein
MSLLECRENLLRRDRQLLEELSVDDADRSGILSGQCGKIAAPNRRVILCDQ